MPNAPILRRSPLATAALAALALSLPVQDAVCQPALAAEGPHEALALVGAMIEAHGGMERWASAPTVSFEDRWGDSGPSRVTVEQGRRRAYIDFPGTDTRMSWDGETAWSENWAAPMPPRFLALLNYYFLNLPWLARDPGVVLGTPGSGRLLGDAVEYRTVEMTFGEGVGDTPDDYYVLYIHPETHRLRACEYIVTYKALLRDGMEHTPPHILIYDELEDVEGLLVPTRFTIYEDGAVYAACTIRDWSFSRAFDEARMTMPEGAVVDTSEP